MSSLRAPATSHQHLAYDGITHQSEFSGAGSGRKRHGRAVEVRSCKAAPLTLVAIVASRTSAMRHRQISHAVRHHTPAKPALDHLLCEQPTAGEVHRWQELPIRKLLQPLA